MWKKAASPVAFTLLVASALFSAAFPGVGIAVIAIILSWFLWRSPDMALEIGVVLVLLVRPWVDLFSERRIGISAFASNPAVIIGLAVLGIAALVALRRGKFGASLWPDRGVLQAHWFLSLTYAVGLFSGVFFYGQTGAMQGVREIVRVAGTVAAFLIVFWWSEDRPVRFHRGWAYLWLGACVPIGVAIWQLAVGRGFLETEGFNRLQGTFSHPNSFGQYLIPFALLALGEALSGSPRRRLWFWGLSASITLFAVLTYSRTVLFALLMAMLILPILHAKRLGVQALARSGLLVVAFGLLAAWIARPYVRERFANLSLGRGALEAALSGESENSYEWRLLNWSVLTSIGLEHPIVGHGSGMTTVLNPLTNAENGIGYNAHNDFVRFFFEAGFLGLAGYLIYGIMFCSWVVRAARRAPLKHAAGSFAIASAWLSLLLLTLGNTELSLHTANLYTLYGMTGLMAGVTRAEGTNGLQREASSSSIDQPFP